MISCTQVVFDVKTVSDSASYVSQKASLQNVT